MRDEDTLEARGSAQASREVLFRNEAGVIGALLAVSLIVFFALVGERTALRGPAGGGALMVALTAVSVSLGCAIVAALFRHDHTKWVLKATVVRDQAERQRRLKLGKWYRRWMRRLMLAATTLLVLGLVALVVGMWARFISP